MMLDWTPRTFQWFEAADAWTGYSKKLARLLWERVRVPGTLLDMGCGMAFPDFALAPHVGEITCVDRDERVIAYVQEKIKSESISNLRALAAKGEEVQGQWDTVMCIFHGEKETILSSYLPLARDTLLVVVHASRAGNIAPEGYKVRKCSGVQETSDFFRQQGISFALLETGIEFGQPLTSLQEAQDFIRAYSRKDIPQEAVTAELESRLVKTGHHQYPYYLPSVKQFGIYTIRRA